METGVLRIGKFVARVYRISGIPGIRSTGPDGLPYTIPSEYAPHIRWASKNGK